jgi:hypothetical protein
MATYRLQPIQHDPQTRCPANILSNAWFFKEIQHGLVPKSDSHVNPSGEETSSRLEEANRKNFNLLPTWNNECGGSWNQPQGQFYQMPSPSLHQHETLKTAMLFNSGELDLCTPQ